MHIWWKRLVAMMLAAGLVLLGVPGPGRLKAAGPAVTLTLPAETLTGMIGAVITVNESVNWRFTAQLGRPGDYPSEQVIRAGKLETGKSITVHFDSTAFKDGVWTLRVEHSSGVDWVVDDYHIITFDNRPGVPLTEPGIATGQIQVVPTATGTVGVHVTVETGGVEWVLRKQAATDAGTKTWSALYSSALKDATYHWYTRNEAGGKYTLRLEVYDTNKHSRYTDVVVTVDNRFGLAQTEPGTAKADLSIPKIISNTLPVDLNFTGNVTRWRLQYVNVNDPNNRIASVASGQAGAAQTVNWNTAGAADGTYLVLLEVEDENKHIAQSTAATTIANKVATTIQQTIQENEEHQFQITVAGGLTSFRLDSTPMGHYQVTVQGPDGKTLASQRMHPLSQPLQLDLPSGKYRLSVRSLFTLPGSKYTVEMKGATAYTIPLARMGTALPLTMRQQANIPSLLQTNSPKPAEAGWYVDGNAPTSLTKPDGTLDIDTRSLTEGRHVITFRSTNSVSFTTLAGFPFVVDNQSSFSDVGNTHPARWAVELLKDLGISNGYSDGTFKPTATVTRAEFAKMLSLAAGLDVTKPYGGAFGDVKAADWFAPYVQAVYDAGFVKGYQTKTGLVFRPDAPVSRAELMVMLLRAAGVPEVLDSLKGVSLPNADWAAVQDWARGSIYVGVKLNLLAERYGRKLEPDSPAERGEVALALARLLLNQQLNRR